MKLSPSAQSNSSTAARLLVLALLPVATLAQSSNSSGNGNSISTSGGGQSSLPVVVTSTFASSIVSVGPSGQTTTFVSSILTTFTQNPQPTGNNTNTNKTSTSTKSSTRPLSTAPDDVTIGGGGPSGAPMPGQTGGGGVYGPDDGYTSSVMGLTANMFLGSLAALITGGIMVLR